MTYRLYGGTYRGHCPLERLDQITFVGYVRTFFPRTYGALIIHVKNEGKKTPKQAAHDKKQGLTVGASDIIIPGSPAFVCELKRKDKTQSTASKDQIKYLEAAAKMGAFSCIAYGYDAAVEAFNDYLKLIKTGML